MRLKYKGDNYFHLVFPLDIVVTKGTEVTTDDQETIDRLKEVGFEEMKPKKNELQKEEPTDKKEGE